MSKSIVKTSDAKAISIYDKSYDPVPDWIVKQKLDISELPLFTGTPALAFGPVKPDNQAITFDGSTYIDFADPTVFYNNKNEWSYCVWVYLSDLPPSIRAIFTHSHFRMDVTTTGIIRVSVYGTLQSSTLALTTGSWHSVICTYKSGNGLKLYQNNSITKSAGITATEVFTPSAVSLGRRIGLAEQWIGNIDDYRYYDYELSTAKVALISANKNV